MNPADSARRVRLALCLTGLSAFLHGYRLSEPRSVVFDEVHFGAFVSAYVGSHAYFFDVHPPHAKLLAAGAAALGGYRGDQEFRAIHDPITQVSPALLRSVPALAGTLAPLLAFVLLLQLGASEYGALLAGLALALDNALLLETRVLVFDGVLIAATLGALTCYLAALRVRGIRRLGWVLATGALGGLAAGTKLTGLAALAMVALAGIGAWARDRRAAMLRAVVGDGLAIAVAALAVYAFGWWLHFALLGEPGPGDRWGAPTGHWIADTIAVQRRMWGANTGLAAQHGYGSAWWSWPLMLRAVSYWSTGGASLALVGNPVVWWGSSVGLVVVLVSAPLRALTKPAAGDPARAWPPGLWLLVCGWALCYFPLAGVRRVLFLYHYLSALVFAVCAVALWLDHSGWLTRPGDWRVQPRALWFLVAALVGGFALLAPFTLAYVHAPAYQEAVFGALPGWR